MGGYFTGNGGRRTFHPTNKGKANEILFENVLIGDVWLCSGQSNMEFS